MRRFRRLSILLITFGIALTGCDKNKNNNNNQNQDSQETGDETPSLKNFEGIIFENGEFAYDGQPHSICVSGNIPESTAITYGPSGNTFTNVGTYEITAALSCEGYNSKSYTATLTINPIDFEGIEFNDLEVVYDGRPHSIYVTGALPPSTSVAYGVSGYVFTEVGEYQITATISCPGYNSKTLTATLTILPATFEGLFLNDVEIIYDGQPHSTCVGGELPENAQISYGENGNSFTNVGTHEVTATVSLHGYVTKVLTATVTIVPASFEGLSLNDAEVVYDGQSHSIEVVGELPENTSVSYGENGNTFTNAGIYEITATISHYGYNTMVLNATLKITKADFQGLSLNDLEVIYDGQPHSIDVAGVLPQNAQVSYGENGNTFTNTGTYEITATIICANYNSLVLHATLSILPATITGISFNSNELVYDGQSHSISVSGSLPQGAIVDYGSSGNTFSNVGVHNITASITCANYNPLVLHASLTILPADFIGLSFESSTVTYNGQPQSIVVVGDLPQGTSVSYSPTNTYVNAGTYPITATVTHDGYNTLVLNATLTILKGTISGVALEDSTVIYDEQEHTISVDGNLPIGASVSYGESGNTFIEVGVYDIKATITCDNYNTLVLNATLRINEAQFEELSFEDVTVDFDGQAHSIEVNGILPTGSQLSYSPNNTYTQPGSYQVTATVTKHGYITWTNTATLTIAAPNQHTGTYRFDAGDAIIGSTQEYVDVEAKNISDENLNATFRITNAQVDNTSAVVASGHSTLFVQNKYDSPLNDISNLMITLGNYHSLESVEQIHFAMYFSYNYLTLENIFDGKYQDLGTYFSIYPAQGSTICLDTGDMVALPNARYFILALETPSSNICINSISMTSSHYYAPLPVEVGTYTYPEVINQKFGGFEDGFPEFGNGSFYLYEGYGETHFIGLQPTGKYEFFLNALDNEGYCFAKTVNGENIYQKDDGGIYLQTYYVSYLSLGSLEIIEIYYSESEPRMILSDDYDLEALREPFASESFKTNIRIPEFAGNVSYSQISQITKEDKTSFISFEFSDGKDQFFNNAVLVKDYIDELVSDSGYNVIEYRDNFVYDDDWAYFEAIVATQDLKYSVKAHILYNGIYGVEAWLIFNEQIFGEFPSQVLAEMFGENVFIPLLTTNGGFYSFALSDNELIVLSNNVTTDEINSYIENLKLTDYYIEKYNYESFVEYACYSYVVINNKLQKICCTIIDFGGSYALRYNLWDLSGQRTFSGAVYQLSDFNYTLVSEFATNFVNYSNINSYYLPELNTIYCYNPRQYFMETFYNICEYDSLLGKYVYTYINGQQSAFRLLISVFDDGPYKVFKFENPQNQSLYFDSYDAQTWNNNFDQTISGWTMGQGLPGTEPYHFPDDLNVKFITQSYYYSSDISQTFIYGNEAESVVEDYIENLLNTGNVIYSEFMNSYANLENNINVSCVYHMDAVIPYVELNFSRNVYKDYLSFNDFVATINYFSYLDEFPSLELTVEENEKGFLLEYPYEDCTGSLRICVKEETISTYKEILENDNDFIRNEYSGTYLKEYGENGALLVSFGSGSIYFNYVEDYYLTQEELFDRLSMSMNAFSNELNVSVPLPGEGAGKLYHIVNCDYGYPDVDLIFGIKNDSFDSVGFVESLSSYGFSSKVVDGEEIFYKLDSENNKFYMVTFEGSEIKYKLFANYQSSSSIDLINQLISD